MPLVLIHSCLRPKRFRCNTSNRCYAFQVYPQPAERDVTGLKVDLWLVENRAWAGLKRDCNLLWAGLNVICLTLTALKVAHQKRVGVPGSCRSLSFRGFRAQRWWGEPLRLARGNEVWLLDQCTSALIFLIIFNLSRQNTNYIYKLF